MATQRRLRLSPSELLVWLDREIVQGRPISLQQLADRAGVARNTLYACQWQEVKKRYDDYCAGDKSVASAPSEHRHQRRQTNGAGADDATLNARIEQLETKIAMQAGEYKRLKSSLAVYAERNEKLAKDVTTLTDETQKLRAIGDTKDQMIARLRRTLGQYSLKQGDDAAINTEDEWRSSTVTPNGPNLS